jgi:cytochrome c-type biogenesis protein CcmF
LFLTGVGPLFAWRRTSLDRLRRNFQWPGIASLVLVVGLFAAGIHKPYPLISFGFCLFVALTVMVEFYKGARSIAGRTGMNLLRATVELTHRNTRRYGGYLVHMGVVLIFIGFTGHAFNQSEVKEMSQGDIMRIGHYELRLASLEQGENANYLWYRGIFQVSKDGQPIGTLQPEKRLFKASKESTSEVAIRMRPNEDLYVNFGGMSDDNQRAVIQAFVNPLVTWVWVGGLVLIGGTLVCLVPSKVKMQYARTQVVGIAKQYVDLPAKR